jgi:FMN reductase (NADPH)/FMN reductase [NAD(P)H]
MSIPIEGGTVNPTLDLIARRTSTRVFAPTPIADAEKTAILSATFRAPTAGNMMLYSIVDVADQALKDRLAVTCDDQPFIAKAPWVLVFLADYQKWTDLFAHADVESLDGVEHHVAPGLGDLMMACSDALIAAQTAVLAAESFGIGSCYIGDVLENGEEHARLLDLPPHTLPVAMVCFGRAAAHRPPTPRYTDHMVHTDRYRRLDRGELEKASADLERTHAPHGLPPGVANIGQSIYQRKFISDYQAEMNRSTAWWLERWQGADTGSPGEGC